MLERKYYRAIWQFYCCYNISLAILQLPFPKSRNSVWRKALKNTSFNEKQFKKIQTFMQEDMNIIIDALNFINKKSKDMAYDMGDIDKPFAVGIIAYEMPD